jgi:hypothetical protein
MKRTTAVAVAAVIVLSAIALAFAADSVSKSDKVVMPPFHLSGKMSDQESAHCSYDEKETRIVDAKSELSAAYVTEGGIHCVLTLSVVSEAGEFGVQYQYDADDGRLIPTGSARDGGSYVFIEPSTGDRLTVTPGSGGLSKIRFQGEAAVQRSSDRYSIISFDVSTKMSGNVKYVIDNEPMEAAGSEAVFRISGKENGRELSGTARIAPVNSYGAHYDSGGYYATQHVYRCVLEVDGTSLPDGLTDFMFLSTGEHGSISFSAYTDDGRLESYRISINRNDEYGTLRLDGASEIIEIVDGKVADRQALAFHYEAVQ